MPPAALSPILAQAADTASFSKDNPTFAVGVVGVLLAIFFAVDKIDGFVQRRRRQPTLDAQLERMANAITALTGSVDELKKARDSHAGHSTQLGLLERRCVELEKQASEDRAKANREISELREKSEREAAANRKYTMETTREIFELMRKQAKESADEIKALTSSTNKVFQDFALQIGALTEAVKKNAR